MAIPRVPTMEDIQSKIKLQNMREDREFWKDCIKSIIQTGSNQTVGSVVKVANTLVSQLQEFRKSQ